jgi:hypothetical protein
MGKGEASRKMLVVSLGRMWRIEEFENGKLKIEI